MQSLLRRLALFLSVAGHPFILIPLTLLAATRSLLWPAVVAATTTLPMLGVIVRNVRRGEWSDHDASRHEQRSGVYTVAFPLLLVAALVLFLLDAPAALMRGILAGAGMLAVGLVANRWLKVSMHMMFAAFCAMIIGREFVRAFPLLIVFVIALAWSRRHLDRHTWPEIIVGTLAGLAAGGVLFHS